LGSRSPRARGETAIRLLRRSVRGFARWRGLYGEHVAILMGADSPSGCCPEDSSGFGATTGTRKSEERMERPKSPVPTPAAGLLCGRCIEDGSTGGPSPASERSETLNCDW